MEEPSQEEEGYILEFVTIGTSVKVTAFDPVTLREASVIGPTSATQQQLAELAIRKLHYVLGKEGGA